MVVVSLSREKEWSTPWKVHCGNSMLLSPWLEPETQSVLRSQPLDPGGLSRSTSNFAGGEAARKVKVGSLPRNDRVFATDVSNPMHDT